MEKERALRTWEVMKTARDLSMTASEVHEALEVFHRLDEDATGVLEFPEFEQAALTLLRERTRNTHTPADRQSVVKNCEVAWASKERDASGMGMQDFLCWFSRNRFSSEFFLTSDQRRMRELSRTYGVSEKEVDLLSTSFDLHVRGEDGLTAEMFGAVLRSIMRLPEDFALPIARLQFFWRELDTERTGKVSFEAFISWWSRRSCWLLPYDRFYKKVRDLSSLSPDPPVRDQLGLSEQPGDDGAEEDEEAEGEQEEEEEEEHFLEQSQQDSW